METLNLFRRWVRVLNNKTSGVLKYETLSEYLVIYHEISEQEIGSYDNPIMDYNLELIHWMNLKPSDIVLINEGVIPEKFLTQFENWVRKLLKESTEKIEDGYSHEADEKTEIIKIRIEETNLAIEWRELSGYTIYVPLSYIL